MVIEKTKNNKHLHWLLWTAIIFFVVFLFLICAYLAHEKKYIGKIYRGAHIGEMDLSGKTFKEAEKIINEKINLISQNGINFYYGKNKATIFPIISSPEGDIAYQIINFETEKTLTESAAFGRNNNFVVNFTDKIKAFLSEKEFLLAVNINESETEKILKEKFYSSEIPAEEAKLTAETRNMLAGEKNIYFKINDEKLGRIIDYQKGISELKNRLARLNAGPIELFSSTSYPQIYKKDCLNIESEAEKILTLAPIILKCADNEWVIDREELAGWLGLKINQSFNKETAGLEKKVIIGLNGEAKKFLEEKIAAKINKNPIEAKFEMKDGKVSKFQAGENGLELDTANSLLKIELELTKLKANASTTIELAVKEIKSAVSVGNINDMGIKEIIGTGESNFKGSPKNRRHNIKVGADSLSGLLIKPGEEFSAMKALGKIDGSTGYLPELVIKDNKTTPEFGGGLCQIGTTMFRAALASGLPITMRRNHSYRVVYYEPAGTDATIYDPWPDFKFINDTTNYILIQARLKGDNLYFDFWGTKDGRVVGEIKPTIYNIVKPGPTKEIETTDLKPGEKKCTERPHNGADAYFNYKVTYPNGEIYPVKNSCPENQKNNALNCESSAAPQTTAWDKISNGIKEKKFNSHYVPWQEVCLIGVEKLSDAQEGVKNEVQAETPANATQ